MANRIIDGIEYEDVEVCIRYRTCKGPDDLEAYLNECNRVNLLPIESDIVSMPVNFAWPDKKICAKCNRPIIWDDWNYDANGNPIKDDF